MAYKKEVGDHFSVWYTHKKELGTLFFVCHIKIKAGNPSFLYDIQEMGFSVFCMSYKKKDLCLVDRIRTDFFSKQKREFPTLFQNKKGGFQPVFHILVNFLIFFEKKTELLTFF